MPKFKRFRLVLDRKSSTKKNNASTLILQKQESLPNFSKLLIDPRSFTIPTCLNHLIDGSRGQDNKKFWSNRIKVILKIQEPPKDTNSTSCVTINKQQSCIGLIDPTPSRRSSYATNNHVNLFPFDSILTDADPPNILSIQALNNAIFELFRGKDSCIFSFGHSGLGKTRTMIGSDKEIGELGVIPHALGLVYRLIELRNNSNSSTSTINYSISISAIVVNRTGVICDLLQSQSNTKKNDSNSSASVGPVELPADNLKEASRLLDMILAARLSLASINNGGSNDCEKMSHLRMIIHLYQSSSSCMKTTNHEWSGSNRTASQNITKSRLVLLDLGSGRSSSDDSSNYPGNLSVQGMCKVLLALYTSQLHIPHKDNQLTQIMRDSIHTGSHAVMLLHISGKQQNYNETLQVVQLASKLHRTCRGRSSRSASSNHQSNQNQHQYQLDETTSSYSSSSSGSRRKPRPHMGISGVGGGSGGRRSCGATSSSASELDITSASEMSSCCETVIYRGPSARNSDHNVNPSVSETSDYGDSTKINPRTRTVSGSGSISNDSGSNNNYCSPNILRRRRMSPRTNARAWPLSPTGNNSNNTVADTQPIQIPDATINNSTKLESTSASPNTAELWVDGPNAVYKQQQTQIELTIHSEQKHDGQRQLETEVNGCSMKMVSKETQYTDEWERSSSSLAEEEVEVMIESTTSSQNPSINQSNNHSGVSSASTSATSSLANTLDRAHKEPRPLSDISECTEETESVRATSSVQEGDTRSSAGLDDDNEDGFHGMYRGETGDNLSPNLGDIDQLLDTATNQFNQLHLPRKEMTSVATSPLLSRSNIMLNQRQNQKHNTPQLDQTSHNEYSHFHFNPGNRINLSNMNNSPAGVANQNQTKLQSTTELNNSAVNNQPIIINNDITINHHHTNDNSNSKSKTNSNHTESDKNNKNDIKINSEITDLNVDIDENVKPIDSYDNNNNANKLSVSKSNNNATSGSIVHYHSAEESTRRFSKSSTSDQKTRSSKRNCKKCKQHISASTGGQSEGSISTSHHHSRRHHHRTSSSATAQQKSMTSSCSSTDFNRVASWIETVEKEINTNPSETVQPPNPPIASVNEVQTLFNTTLPYTNFQSRETDVLTTAHSEPPTSRVHTAFYYAPQTPQGSQPDVSLLHYPQLMSTTHHQYSYYEPQHHHTSGSIMYYPPPTSATVNYNHLPLPPVPPAAPADIDPATTTANKPKSKTLPRDLYADINLAATRCTSSPIKRNNSDLYTNPVKYPTSITPENTKTTNKKEGSKNFVSFLFAPILNLKQKMSRNSAKSTSTQPLVISDPIPTPQQHQTSYPAQVFHAQPTRGDPHQSAEWPQHAPHQYNQPQSQQQQIFISSPYNLMTAPKTGHVLPTESSGHGSDSSSMHRGGHTVNFAGHSAHKSQPNLSSNRQLRKAAITSVNRTNNSRQTTSSQPPLSGVRQQRRPTSSGYGSIIMKNSNSMGGGGGGDSSELSSHNDSSSEYSNYPVGGLVPTNNNGLGKLRHSRSLSNCKSSAVDPLQPTSYTSQTHQINVGSQIHPAQQTGVSRSHTHLNSGSSHTNLIPMMVPRPDRTPSEGPPLSQVFIDNQQNVRIAENLIFQEKLRMTLTEERRTVIQLIETNRLRGLCIDPAIMSLTCFKGVDNLEVTTQEQRTHCEMLIQTVENEIMELKQKLLHAQNNLVMVTSFNSSSQTPNPASTNTSN